MAKLLSYLVDQNLAGTDRGIKADTIAVEALGRDSSFDSGTDSYPRVQIGRLRKLLDRFYADNPSDGRFDIPLGDYRIVLHSANPVSRTIGFSASVAELGDHSRVGSENHETDASSNTWNGDMETEILHTRKVLANTNTRYDTLREPHQPTGPDVAHNDRLSVENLKKRQAYTMLGVAAFILIAASLWALGLYPKGETIPSAAFVDSPVLTVDEVQPDTASAATIAAKVDTFWGGSFRRFEVLRLRTRSIGNDNIRAYRLSTLVLESGPAFDISVQLRDPAGQIIWSRVTQTDGETNNLEDALATIVARVSPLDGVIGQNFLRYNGQKFAPGYPCLLQQNVFVRYRRAESLPKIRAWLQESIDRAQDPAPYLAALSLMKFIEEGKGNGQRIGKTGTQLAREAIDSNPESSAAVLASACAAFFNAECQRGKKLSEKALELNPYNARIMSYTGIYLLGCGDAEAESYLRRSMALRPNQITDTPIALALLLLQGDRDQEATEVINDTVTLQVPSEPQHKLVRALASAKRGDIKAARRLWSELAREYPVSSPADPGKIVGQFIITPSIIPIAVKMLEQEEIVR